MWSQNRFVVGIDKRVCTNEGTSMDMSSKYIYTQMSECRSFFFFIIIFFCFYKIAKLLTSIFG